jgi:cellobiose phosphorylase
MINMDDMRARAEKVAIESNFSFRDYSLKKLVNRLDANHSDIVSYSTGLSDLATRDGELYPGSTWILDNFYKVDEQVKQLKMALGKRQKINLGVLDESIFKGYPRIYPAALNLVEITNGNFNEEIIINYLKAYQNASIFSMGELWIFNTMLVLAVIERIKEISDDIYQNQLEREKVKKLNFEDPSSALEQIKNDIGNASMVSPSYIEYLVRMIRREHEKYEYVSAYLKQKLMEYDTTIEKTVELALRTQSSYKSQIGNLITSLNKVSLLNWNNIFESVSIVENILRKDPSGIYLQMDFESRDYYRHQIELFSKKTKYNETRIALKLLNLAEEAKDSESPLKETHVGYYIAGNGRERLVSSLGFANNRRYFHDFSTASYLLPIFLLTVATTVAFIYHLAPVFIHLRNAVLAGLIMFIPISEIIIKLVNWIFLKITPPVFLPKLHLRDGIPDESATIVVIPSLITAEESVTELFDKIETYYLANKNSNLYFALLGEFKDAKTEFTKDDNKIIKRALGETVRLNKKYSPQKNIFFYFQRKRLFNSHQKKWICWERKRGSLTELGNLLSGSAETSHIVVSSNISELVSRIRYVITLDEDTQLPIDSARKLIGTISHPLNQAVFNPNKGRVEEGYGFIQPSVSISVDSSNASRFTQIYARNTGVSIYSENISDLYQDLFNEGIFMGKGIYDLPLFNAVLNDAIPENRILSHDLLEGSHIRAAFATDIELVDNHPTKYFSYMMRLHRWIRGDWQLIPWLRFKIVNKKGIRVNNPLSALSKWKILDNLRRSLYTIALFVLIVGSATFFPSDPWRWLTVAFLSMFLPLLLEILDSILSGRHQTPSRIYNRRGKVKFGMRGTLQLLLLQLIFLPYEAYVTAEAITISLYRLLISKDNLLEWVPASISDKEPQPSILFFISKMRIVFLEVLLFLCLVVLTNNESSPLPWIFAIVWLCSPFIAFRLCPEKAPRETIPEKDALYLRLEARKIWAFYEDLAQKSHNYLPPDNIQIYPPRAATNRTSPTNIGLMLLATVSARDMGYLSITRMITIIKRLLTTVSKLEKWNGHLYNWYNTNNLSILRPRYISTVDSGNFIGYLITLKQSLKEYRNKPLIDDDIVQGLRETCEISGSMDKNMGIILEGFGNIKGKEAHEWKGFLDKMVEYGSAASVCSKKTESTMQELLSEYDKYYTIIIYPEDIGDSSHPVFKEILEDMRHIGMDLSLSSLRKVYNEMIFKIRKIKSKSTDLSEKSVLIKLENKLKAIICNLDDILRTFDELSHTIDRIVEKTDFYPLYDESKSLFSIGYDWENDYLTDSYYDLMASEARQTSFLAVVNKQVPLKHWYRLGRALTVSDGFRVLASWSGTMFEYFMPHLILKNYENTLFDETYHSVIETQKLYGKNMNRPWGLSESAYYHFDIDLNYQYKAFGVPGLGFKRGLVNDYVVSPYASFFGLPFDRNSVISNLKHLEMEGLEGPYGFYESADYTRERIGEEDTKKIVQTYMAHHLGMSMVAINNYLNDSVMQNRFHSEPVVKTGASLLQEKLPFRVIITHELKEKAREISAYKTAEVFFTRVFHHSKWALPRCHVLSNKDYQVVLTNNGDGFSRYQGRMVTRWREDILGNNYGLTFYFKNLEDNEVWSAGFRPVCVEPESYEARFSLEKAEFVQSKNGIGIHMEIWVSPEDNVEVRRISIVNKRKRPVIIETTSYAEISLNTQDADLAHRAFSNLFVSTSFDRETESLVATRNPRGEDESALHLFHTVSCEGQIYGNTQYETDRQRFIGRGRKLSNPVALEKVLDNSSGVVLDPIVSLRKSVRINPNQKAVLTFSMGVTHDKDELGALVSKYKNPHMVKELSDLAAIQTQVEANYLALSQEDLFLFQDMVSQILYISPQRKKHSRIISYNIKGQDGLWPFGISGDVPIVLASIKCRESMSVLWQLLKAKEYWRLKGIPVDLVILNLEESGYFKDMEDEIRDMTSRKFGYASDPKSMGIFILNKTKLSKENISLLYAVSRIIVDCEKDSLEKQVQMPQELLPPPTPLSYLQHEFPKQKIVFRSGKLKYFNGYGGFDEKQNEYVIRLKDGDNTPAPWINVVSNDRFGFTVSETGGGYTWFENSRENKLTPWTNDSLYDDPHEIIYLKDDVYGKVWSATPKPLGEGTDFEISHGKGYSSFVSCGHEILTNLELFVPVNEPVKLFSLRLKNQSSIQRKLSAFFYIRPVLGVTNQKTQQHIKTRLAENQYVFITNPYNHEFPDQIQYLASSEPLVSFTGNRDDFSGDVRIKLLSKKTLSNSCGVGLDPCGALHVSIDLEPGEKKKLVFMMGVEKKVSRIFERIEKYKNPEAVEKAQRNAAGYWSNLTGRLKVKTPDNKFDSIINGWLVYQTLSSRIKGRTAFYQAGGAYGYRDQLQDSMNMLLVDPSIAKKQIIIHASHQFEKGDVLHWWHSGIAEKGIRTRFSDDSLWLPYAVAEYLRITGNTDFLWEEIPYVNGPTLSEGENEKYISTTKSILTESLYLHCVRAIDRALKYGEHGIPLMGGGDWNDGMNAVGVGGKGESVWLGWFLHLILKRFLPICGIMNDSNRTTLYHEASRFITESIEKNAWDGSWYMRAFYDDGSPLGSIQNAECMIASLPQSWSVISGGASHERARIAMNAVTNHLVRKEKGIVLLFTPPFEKTEMNPGYIKSYAKGLRENGGQYTHAAAWVVQAFAKLGDGNKAYELFEMLNPINHSRSVFEANHYKVEPYVVAADIYSADSHAGRGGWTWYTGAAGWLYKVGLEDILGFVKKGTSLYIKPCIPKFWKKYSIEYTYMHTLYRIDVQNPASLSTGQVHFMIDGKASKEDCISLIDDGKIHNVIAVLKSE